MLDSLEKKILKDAIQSLDIYYHLSVTMVTAITRGHQEKRIDFGYSFMRQHSICSCLLLYVQGNFTDKPVSKSGCQSQTLRQPFKPLLSLSFTPEP